MRRDSLSFSADADPGSTGFSVHGSYEADLWSRSSHKGVHNPVQRRGRHAHHHEAGEKLFVAYAGANKLAIVDPECAPTMMAGADLFFGSVASPDTRSSGRGVFAVAPGSTSGGRSPSTTSRPSSGWTAPSSASRRGRTMGAPATRRGLLSVSTSRPSMTCTPASAPPSPAHRRRMPVRLARAGSGELQGA